MLDEIDEEKAKSSSAKLDVSRRNELAVLDTLPRPDGDARRGREGNAMGTATAVVVEDGEEAADGGDTERVGTAGAEFRTLLLGPREGRDGAIRRGDEAY